MEFAKSPSSRHLPTSAFAVMRAAVGIGSLIAPAQICGLFGIDFINGSTIMLRLFGARELVLASLLWRSQSRARHLSSGKGGSEKRAARESLRSVLWAGVFIDSIDIVSSAVCILEGNMSGKAIWLVGGGAAVFATLGGMGLGATTN